MLKNTTNDNVCFRFKYAFFFKKPSGQNRKVKFSN